MENKFTKTRDQSYFQEKLQRAMDRHNLGALILTQPEAVFYATGFMGCSHYRFRSCGNAIAVVPAQGRVTLIVSQFEAGGARLQTKGEVEIETYPVWIYIEDFDDPNETEKDPQPDPMKTFRMAADIAAQAAGGKTVGVERSAIPYDKFCYLKEKLGEERLLECADLLTECKKIKSQWEIDLCRYTAEVAEQVMEYVMRSTQAGMTEADLVRLFTTRAYEITGGVELTKVNNVHTVGPCYWSTLVPRDHVLKEGEIVRLDGGVQIYGYLSDLARTYVVGREVAPEKQHIFDALLAGFDAGMGMIGPGVKLSDAFGHILEVIRSHNLPTYVRGHFGHTTGSGLTEDYPMICAKTDEVFQPGMVFCLETPYYSSKHDSYNLEDEFVITETGMERFTHINRSLIVGS
ncbi:MAG TPA: Xaa-Pro peptidase family protein [Candidatus Flavonifractor merdigallinarum]|uniref:Xaa-Pro peptidase family protein n=1 Tax=Candidatus Flavonifractor merdigallinarum TaxID=2838589 RepID=A0A9D1YAX4_9FIRM|nr:Xaa-Pro peptidase family protein [Candidatus Flavonifractor merdigallinarum]